MEGRSMKRSLHSHREDIDTKKAAMHRCNPLNEAKNVTHMYKI